MMFALPFVLVACGPSDFEKQKLAFEERKYNDEQAAKTEAARLDALDKEEQSGKWSSCRVKAEGDFNDEVKLWGEPTGKAGIRSGPANQLQEMKNRLQRKNEECDRNFPRGISW